MKGEEAHPTREEVTHLMREEEAHPMKGEGLPADREDSRKEVRSMKDTEALDSAGRPQKVHFQEDRLRAGREQEDRQQASRKEDSAGRESRRYRHRKAESTG